MNKILKDYLSAGLEILAVIFSGTAFYVLSDEGARTVILFAFHGLKEEEIISKIRYFQENFSFPIIAAWIVFTVITIIVRIRSQKRISSLENIIETKEQIISTQKEKLTNYALLKQNIDLIFKEHLKSIARSLYFTSNERISLYIIDEDKFVRCARFSQNPKYNQPGRSGYPLNEGVIGEAWSKGSDFIMTLPDIQKSKEQYIEKTNSRYGIPKEDIANFSMFPRLILGYRISNHDRSEHNAVIIVESTNKNFNGKNNILMVLERNRECLYGLIKDFREFIPALARAEKEDM